VKKVKGASVPSRGPASPGASTKTGFQAAAGLHLARCMRVQAACKQSRNPIPGNEIVHW